MVNKQGILFIIALFCAWSVSAKNPPIRLEVDATEATKEILHARLHIPASPGKLTLVYPQWLPGEHSPDGPINGVTGLKFFANGQPLMWQRDAENMFQFTVDVPAGASEVEAALDFLLTGGGGGYSAGDAASGNLLILSWNHVLLYPAGTGALDREFAPSITLPEGWRFGTALPGAKTSGVRIEFSPARLETLIDSPLVAGKFFRRLDLGEIGQTPHHVHIVADSAEALAIKAEDEARLGRLVREANALFGARHYRSYHFLVTLSDRVAHFGLEHHESSDCRLSEDFFTDDNARALSAELLPHELVHSWNGKYRRPAGMTTPDYQTPVHGELLWVYEGLTDYYGKVLAARSGLMTTTNFRGVFALNAAALDHRAGRTWRSLADTTISAQLLYNAPGTGTGRRRGADFYPEGDLLWLEVDTLIRRETQGKKSLDDFCKIFHGGASGSPQVKPYSLAEVIRTLNEVAAYDWKTFFQQRVYDITPRAPLGGIENAGWRLAYTNVPSSWLQLREGQRSYTDLNYSLGFTVGSDGAVGDVRPGSPGDQAGLVQGVKLVAVDGHAWSAKKLRTAVANAATNSAPIELLTLREDFYRTLRLNYRGGERYPVLERIPGTTDWLEKITAPLTPATTNSPSGR